jgi:hypothetical protein
MSTAKMKQFIFAVETAYLITAMHESMSTYGYEVFMRNKCLVTLMSVSGGAGLYESMRR